MEQPAADYDGAWKLGVEVFCQPFLALFFPDVHAAIDWTEPLVFRDPELQQIAPHDTAGKQRVDRLVEVTRRDGQPALVLIHIEIQAQRDPAFAERMFLYNARLYDRERRPVVSLAVLGDAYRRWRPTRYSYALWGCALDFRFPTVKLRTLDAARLEAAANPIATLTLLHRDAQDTQRTPEGRLTRKLQRFRALLQAGFTRDEIARLLQLMEHVLRLPEELEQVARDAMRQIELEETGMDTFVTSFERIGRAEGRVEGQRAVVLRQLTHKLGALPEDAEAQVTALTPEQLLALSEALLDFTTQGDLAAWLAQHSDDSAT